MRPVPGRFLPHLTSGHAALVARCRDYRQGANAINQGDIVLTAEQPQWLKVALT